MAIDPRSSVRGTDHSTERPTTVDSAASVLILANNVWNIANFRIELVRPPARLAGQVVPCAVLREVESGEGILFVESIDRPEYIP